MPIVFAESTGSPWVLLPVGLGIATLIAIGLYQRSQAGGTLLTAELAFETSSSDGVTVTGTWKGRTIELSQESSKRPGASGCFLLRTPISNYGLRFRDRSFAPPKGATKRERRQNSGNLLGDFDGRYEVLDDGGRPVNEDVRAAAYQVQFAVTLFVEEGYANLELPLFNTPVDELQKYFDQLDRVADAIDRTERSLGERVLDHEADAEARVQWLEEALQQPGAESLCQDLLMSAYEEPHELLYLAAMHVGDTTELASLLGSAQLPTGTLDALLPYVVDADPDAAIAGLVGSPHPRMWSAAVELATSPERLSLTLPLVEHYLQFNTLDGATFAMRIGASELPEAADVLRKLALAPHTETAVAAVLGLGAHGTLADVATLRARQRGAAGTPELSEAIEASVRSIQERLGGEAGGVSLTAAQGGELGLAGPKES